MVVVCRTKISFPSASSILLPDKPTQRRAQLLPLAFLEHASGFPVPLFPQRVDLQPLLVDDVPVALLAQVLPQTAVLAPAPRLVLQAPQRVVVVGLAVEIFLPLALRRGREVQPADVVLVQGDHVRLQLVEQGLDLRLLPLLRRLVRVHFERVEVRLARARHDDAAEAFVVRYAQHVLERAPPHAFDPFPFPAPRHVRRLDFFLVRGRAVEEAFPDGNLRAPSHGREVAVADLHARPRLPQEVIVDFAELADVPDAHLQVGAGGDHVVAGSIDGGGADGAAVGEEFDERGGGVGGPECDGAVLVAEVEDGVAGVLSHGCGGAESCWDFREGRAGRGVGVLEVSCIALEKFSGSTVHEGT